MSSPFRYDAIEIDRNGRHLFWLHWNSFLVFIFVVAFFICFSFYRIIHLIHSIDILGERQPTVNTFSIDSFTWIIIAMNSSFSLESIIRSLVVLLIAAAIKLFFFFSTLLSRISYLVSPTRDYCAWTISSYFVVLVVVLLLLAIVIAPNLFHFVTIFFFWSWRWISLDCELIVWRVRFLYKNERLCVREGNEC